MKKLAFVAAMLAISAFAETNSIDWRYGKPGIRVVTNAPSVALFTAEVARVDARIDGIGFADNSHKMNITGGISTNQTLYSPIVTNKLSFGTAFADALVTGEVAWDPDWMTFRAGVGDGVTGQFFQESHIYAKNVSGQTVTNGMAVRFSGAVGNSGKCEFVLAKAEAGVRPAATLGIATHDIANGALGKITWFGNVNALDTTGALYGETGWTDNMIVYLSTNTPGFLTRFEPQAPQPRISLGAVINAHANAGTILVRPTWGMRVTEADDVDGTPLTASGQIMVWDQARGVFDFTDNIGNYSTTNSLAAHTNRTDNPHSVTAQQIGAITAELDPVANAALAAYAAYWPRNATASSWFTFVTNSGAITITGYNIAGGTDVVIPDYINGLPVTEIGVNAFIESGVTSIGGAGNVVTVGADAFGACYSLASVSLPLAQTVGDSAFYACASLASVSLPRVQTVGGYAFSYCGGLTSLYFDNHAPTIGAEIFTGITPNQVTNYVTNPQATGWGATLGGMPVVRLPLYTDAITLNGDTITDWPVGATNLTVGATSVPYDAATRTFDGTGILFPVTSGTATNPSFIGSATLNGQPLLTNAPPGATMTYLTNSFGVTTQQVWTIGGAVSTNFFTSKALVPQTGQTNVYYGTGCDGCLKIGFPLPSPRFSLVADTGPATNQVLDNLTGLIWCRDAGRTPTNWVSIFEAVSNMNVEAYAGATDWRLPNVREMLSLIHFGFIGPAISSLLGSSKGSAGDPFFGVSLATVYATSTTRSANTTQCFTCGLYDGTIGLSAKTIAFNYIPVRGP